MNHQNGTIRHRRGFTLVEMLVVFVIIVILVSILAVALGGAIKSARRSKATVQLQSIGNAIDAFEEDFRYVPPLVTPSLVSPDSSPTPTGLVTPTTYSKTAGNPDDIGDYYEDVRYNSEYTLAVYLLGIGALNPDELDDDGIATGGTPLHDGVPGPGFKAPGDLRAWKVQPPSGPLRHEPQLTGRTYGPYLDFGTLEGILELDEDRGLYKITDPWGNPIRYYSGWTGIRMVNGNRIRSLDEIPIELRSSESLQAQASGADLDTLLGFDGELRTAKYALLCAGESSDDYFGENPYTLEQNVFIPPFGDVVFESDGNTTLVTTYNALNTEQQVSFEKQVSTNLRYVK
ncbi:MAG: type II secretion system protein [Phycisphaerales bacterium JB050]